MSRVEVIEGIEKCIHTTLSALFLGSKPEWSNCDWAAEAVVGKLKAKPEQKPFKQIVADHAKSPIPYSTPHRISKRSSDRRQYSHVGNFPFKLSCPHSVFWQQAMTRVETPVSSALPAENLRLDRPLPLSRLSRFAPMNAKTARP